MRKETALRRIRLILAVLGISVLYILLFSRPAEEELLVRPLWTLDIEDASISSSEGELVPFRLGSLIGYHGSDGALVFREEIIHDAALFPDRFVNYSSVSQTAVLRDPEGRVLLSINEPGYPLGVDERLYLLHPDGAGLSEWSTEGEALWSRKLPSLITDVAPGESLTALGLLSGEIFLLDQEGGESARYRTLGSRIPAVFGLDFDEGSSSIAAVVGIDPQRILFLSLSDGQLSPGIQGDLASDFRRPVFVEFLPGYNLVAVETPEGITFINPSSGRSWPLGAEGILSGFSASDGELVLAATERQGLQDIRAVLPPERLVFSLSADAEAVSLDIRNWVCYLGIDDHILAVTLERG